VAFKQLIQSRFFTNYGMLFVLLLLCVFFSWATLREQNPEGATAATVLAKEIAGRVDVNATILIAARAVQEDEIFSNRLSEILTRRGYLRIEKVLGGPAEVREKLEAMIEQGRSPALIATTAAFASSINQIKDRVAPLAQTSVATPSSYLWPTFLLTDNLLNVANQIVVIAIIAVGMTMVIITAGIDLSVGSLIALSAVVVTWLIRAAGGPDASVLTMILCALAAIALCGGIGAFSGLMITRFHLPPFIATRGMRQEASGFAYIISRGRPIYEVPDSFVWLGRGTTVLSLPYAVLLMAAIYALAHILMSRTTLGRYIYAVGGNAEAARLSGVRVNRILLFVYIVCGAMAGLGGIVMASQLKSGAPTYGLMYELYVIAAAVVGGTSLMGGEGRIMGTLIGAFIIAVIQNGMNLTNVESYTQKVVLGFVILGAVLLDQLKKYGWRRGKTG
jgi:ribose transport system permease protein